MSKTLTAEFTLDALRDRLSQRLNYIHGEQIGDFTQNPDLRKWVMSRAVKEAAILMPLVEREGEMSLLLTKRADKLSSHSGQIAFPGGKIDADDAGPEAAALREAHEEVGLATDQVEILGRLPDYYTGSGYKIAPIIGIMNADAVVEANPDEVDYIFEVPLSFLMNPDNHIRGSRIFEGRERHFFEMPFEEHHIWGITAGMIRVLYDRLYK
ncbi:MAG: CoA pyrophosphatase [Hyphomicrobiales bacterium]|nr:MAG: CoA pyrophosphatase [Hyphomicrobiales bacterium]